MKKLVVANWKMNPASLKEAESLWTSIAKSNKPTRDAEIVVCPSFPYLYVSKKLKFKNITLGAQDVSSDAEGAHTGEVSASMLASLGVKYVIVGHSDNRKAGDTNEVVNKKILQALKSKLKVILCIGESTRDDHGFYLSFLKTQIHECFAGVSRAQLANIVIAYEPIWSISTNPNAVEDTPADSLEISIFILKTLSDIFSTSSAKDVRILYGGSVNEINAQSFLEHGGVSGVLVGRASLDPKKFTKIANPQS
jgi:triosephosphate isomerase (TIM)